VDIAAGSVMIGIVASVDMIQYSTSTRFEVEIRVPSPRCAAMVYYLWCCTYRVPTPTVDRSREQREHDQMERRSKDRREGSSEVQYENSIYPRQEDFASLL
jgi:hypothetical protein